MLDTVVFYKKPPEDAQQRLVQGGIQVHVLLDDSEQLQCTQSRESPPLVLGTDHVPPGTLAWSDVAPKQVAPGADGSGPATTQHIMQAIVQYNRQQVMAQQHAAASSSNSTSDQQLLVVGYVMKPSREAALAAAGMLHLLPNDGVCFMPVDLETLTQQSPLHQDQQQVCQQQQVHIDILLHKGSDELVALGPSSSSSGGAGGDTSGAGCGYGGSSETTAADMVSAPGPDAAVMSGPAAVGVTWSPRLRVLQSWLTDHPQVCVVDPFEHTAKVLDRLLLAKLLQQLRALPLPGGVVARGPGFLEVTTFAADGLADAVAAAGLQPPFIVKPRVACGVSHSHSMALVLSVAALSQLQGQLPAPALVQEFVNHGGQQYKVYVLGQQVFMTPRASIPDIHTNTEACHHQQQQQSLLFDSLASLPTQLPAHLTTQQQQQQQQQQQGSSDAPAAADQLAAQAPAEAAVQAIAVFLRQHLGLTLFGFDVVVAIQQQQQQQSPRQELVVIDVNYFPNYRGGTQTPAMFRAALREAWDKHQQQQQQQHG